MKFFEEDILKLRDSVKKRLSQKRFIHTLGVEKMAIIIGEKCLPDELLELRVAALLHDISKEYSEAEHFELLKKHNIKLDETDANSFFLLHSITAPLVISDEYPFYATKNVLSASKNHTVGSPDMTVFDEIIMLSDYIEEGRKYSKCVRTRDDFLSLLSSVSTLEKCIFELHKACVISLNNTIDEFVSRGESFHSKTSATRDSLLLKLERK